MHTVETPHSLLNGQDEPLFHLLRACPRIGNGDLDDVGLNGGEYLLGDPAEDHEAAQETEHHDEVGRHGVPGHPGNRAAGRPQSVLAGNFISFQGIIHWD